MSEVAENRTVFGVGINDAGYPLSYRVNGERVCDPIYTRWKAMIQRGYSPLWKSRHPAYVETSVDPAWHRFSSFRDWMESRDWEGLHLDKDILLEGNTVYGPENCRLVPLYLNNLLTDSLASRGESPMGVHAKRLKSGNISYHSNCRSGGEYKYLGAFKTAKEAHFFWQNEKKAAILSTLERYKLEECYLPEILDALMRRVEKLSTDIENGRETVRL